MTPPAARAAPGTSRATSRLLWDGLAVAAAVAWHAALLFVPERYAGVDAYFHVGQSRELWTQGLTAGVRALPFTVLGEGGPDHHFLFHVLGLPLSFVGGLVGVKLTALLFAGVATCGVVAWLRAMRAPAPWLWTLLLLATSEVYNFRMSLLRTQTVDVPLVLFAVTFVIAGRRRAAALLAFVFAWTHHGATVLLPVAVVCVVGVWLARRLAGSTPDRAVDRPGAAAGLADVGRAAAWLCAGFVLGQLVNPWFPDNLEYLFFHALFKTANPLGLPVGGEWLPARPDYIASELWPAHLALLAGVAALARFGGLAPRGRGPSVGADTLAMAGVWALFVVMTLKHGRFVGFLVPVQVGFAALVARDALRAARGPLASTDHAAPPSRSLRAGVALCALLCVGLLPGRFAATTALLGQGAGADDYRAGAAWLERHASPGEVVFNLRWDLFPRWWFHSPQLRFAIGLDPNYLAYRSPKHFQLWNNLRAGQRHVPDLGARLGLLFGARYVVATAEEAPLLAPYDELELAFASPATMIWRVKGATATRAPSAGTPAAPSRSSR